MKKTTMQQHITLSVRKASVQHGKLLLVAMYCFANGVSAVKEFSTAKLNPKVPVLLKSRNFFFSFFS